MRRFARALTAGIIMLLAIACGGETPTAPSTALAGTIQVFSAKGDDYAYFLDVALTASAPRSVTINSLAVTITTASSSFATTADLPLSQTIGPGATLAEPRLTIKNQPGLGYASTISALVKYTDDRGRSGSLTLAAPAPSCQIFYFGASCARTRLQVGETSTCSGFVEFGCQPMFEPVAASQIQWRSDAPGIATMTSDFKLMGVSNGSTTLTGSYSGVSMAIPVCVGPQCLTPSR